MGIVVSAGYESIKTNFNEREPPTHLYLTDGGYKPQVELTRFSTKCS